jgi:hypothetical protein
MAKIYVACSYDYEIEWAWDSGRLRLWRLNKPGCDDTLLIDFNSTSFDLRSIAKIADHTKPIERWDITFSSAKMIDGWVEKILKMKAFW